MPILGRYRPVMEIAIDFDKQEGILAISTSQFYVQVEASTMDLVRLGGVELTNWRSRDSLQIGRTLGHPVWWCRGDNPEEVTILVGPDDETWMLWLRVPLSLVQQIVDQARGK